MRFRKGLLVAAALVLAASLIVAGCGRKQANDGGQGGEGQKPLRVALVINGTFGDKGFFDSARAGMERAKAELGIEYKAIEAGLNPADWEPAARSAAQSGDYDVIIAGTFQMTDTIKALSQEFPNVKFIFFDDAVSIDGKVPSNVYNVVYRQNEGSFLVGAFAALVTTSTNKEVLPDVNPDKVIGFVGGIEIPVIQDFLVGYEAGAKYIDPEVRVEVSYVGDFADAAKGKELTLAQFQRGADIAYNVAGGAGLGVLEAAGTAKKYAIGVDMNQNAIVEGRVLTSMEKRVDNSLFRAIDLLLKGQLPFGSTEAIGIAEGGIAMSTDELYKKYVPQEIQNRMTEIAQKLASGEIKVPSFFEQGQ